MNRSTFWCSLVGFFSLSISLFSHPLDVGYLIVREESPNFHVSLELNPEALKEKLAADFIFSLEISADENPCGWQKPAHLALTSSEQVSLTSKVKCTVSHPQKIRIHPTFLVRMPSTFQLFVRSEFEGEPSELMVASQKEDIVLSRKEKKSLSSFILMGMQHIGATPDEWVKNERLSLPDGIDHILFIVALILACFSFKKILWAATGFTIGHSVTLALGAYDVVHFPQRWVESAIALSIAWMGIEALLQRKRAHYSIETTLFGLVHGLGLASALVALQISGPTKIKALLGFNVGVELGQMGVVLCIFPLIWLLSRSPKLARLSIRFSAVVISICGLVWFIVRVKGQ